eukprot:scaffold6704_cov137-Isochrysis_galbana.AAC.8
MRMRPPDPRLSAENAWQPLQRRKTLGLSSLSASSARPLGLTLSQGRQDAPQLRMQPHCRMHANRHAVVKVSAWSKARAR